MKQFIAQNEGRMTLYELHDRILAMFPNTHPATVTHLLSWVLDVPLYQHKD